MALHIFHDLTLEVQQDRPDAGAELERLLQNLSFVPVPAGTSQPCLRLTVHWQACPLGLPVQTREVFRAEGLSRWRPSRLPLPQASSAKRYSSSTQPTPVRAQRRRARHGGVCRPFAL